MKLVKFAAALAAAAGMLAVGTTVASAESTLEIVKKRDILRCQVGKPSPDSTILMRRATGTAVT